MGTPCGSQQVLTNILTNAVKYTPPGGRIRVALRVDGADAVLSVEDSGFGISPSLLPFVFDMYVQADQTLDRARGGLGIGLALVRRLVELHGGTVAASSDGEGKGQQVHGATEEACPRQKRLLVCPSRGNVVRSPGACC